MQPWNDTSASEEENARARKAYEAVLTVTARYYFLHTFRQVVVDTFKGSVQHSDDNGIFEYFQNKINF